MNVFDAFYRMLLAYCVGTVYSYARSDGWMYLICSVGCYIFGVLCEYHAPLCKQWWMNVFDMFCGLLHFLAYCVGTVHRYASSDGWTYLMRFTGCYWRTVSVPCTVTQGVMDERIWCVLQDVFGVLCRYRVQLRKEWRMNVFDAFYKLLLPVTFDEGCSLKTQSLPCPVRTLCIPNTYSVHTLIISNNLIPNNFEQCSSLMITWRCLVWCLKWWIHYQDSLDLSNLSVLVFDHVPLEKKTNIIFEFFLLKMYSDKSLIHELGSV